MYRQVFCVTPYIPLLDHQHRHRRDLIPALLRHGFPALAERHYRRFAREFYHLAPDVHISFGKDADRVIALQSNTLAVLQNDRGRRALLSRADQAQPVCVQL